MDECTLTFASRLGNPWQPEPMDSCVLSLRGRNRELAKTAAEYEQQAYVQLTKRVSEGIRLAQNKLELKKAYDAQRKLFERNYPKEHLPTAVPSSGGYLLLERTVHQSLCEENTKKIANFIADVCRADIPVDDIYRFLK